MKTILVPYYDDDVSPVALEQALSIAAHFGSYVEGLFVMRPPQIIEAEGIALAGAYITQLKDEWRRRADEARQRFTAVMEARNVPMGDVNSAADKLSAGWREIEGPEGQVLGDYGRLFDLIVLGRTPEQALIDWQVMCESILFESGRPIIVASESAREVIGKRVAIHWNGSTEAARVIALARPLLATCEAAQVIQVDVGTVPGPSAEEVTSHLVRAGINATARVVPVEERTNGEALVEAYQEFSADMLLKGAYTHNRLRQMVFGGATRHVLNFAEIPVFMAR